MNDAMIKKIVRVFLVTFVTVLIATIIALLMLKYNVEGEDNMPFELSKIMIISTGEGIDVSEEQIEGERNLKIVQNNDIYLEILKNKNYENVEIIDKIIIDNMQIKEEPKIGKIKLYRPIGQEKVIYNNTEENEIKEKLEYTGKESSSISNLEIANQGGLILFRCAIEDLGEHKVLVSDEIKQDGTIISTQNIEYKDLQCKVSFDLSIKLKSDITYTATIKLDLPIGNVIQEGTSHYEKSDLKDIIFRRNLR